MMRLAPILLFVLLTGPAFARPPQTHAEQQQYCAYGAGGALVSISDASEPCEVPERDNSLLFWNLVIAGGVLVLVGRELTRRPKTSR